MEDTFYVIDLPEHHIKGGKKAYLPLWLVPVEDKSVVIDGIAIDEHEFSEPEVRFSYAIEHFTPNETEELLTELSRIYRKLGKLPIARYVFTGLMPKKSDIRGQMKKIVRKRIDKNLIVRPWIREKDAIEAAGELESLIDKVLIDVDYLENMRFKVDAITATCINEMNANIRRVELKIMEVLSVTAPHMLQGLMLAESHYRTKDADIKMEFEDKIAQVGERLKKTHPALGNRIVSLMEDRTIQGFENKLAFIKKIADLTDERSKEQITAIIETTNRDMEKNQNDFITRQMSTFHAIKISDMDKETSRVYTPFINALNRDSGRYISTIDTLRDVSRKIDKRISELVDKKSHLLREISGCMVDYHLYGGVHIVYMPVHLLRGPKIHFPPGMGHMGTEFLSLYRHDDVFKKQIDNIIGQ